MRSKPIGIKNGSSHKHLLVTSHQTFVSENSRIILLKEEAANRRRSAGDLGYDLQTFLILPYAGPLIKVGDTGHAVVEGRVSTAGFFSRTLVSQGTIVSAL